MTGLQVLWLNTVRRVVPSLFSISTSTEQREPNDYVSFAPRAVSVMVLTHARLSTFSHTRTLSFRSGQSWLHILSAGTHTRKKCISSEFMLGLCGSLVLVLLVQHCLNGNRRETDLCQQSCSLLQLHIQCQFCHCSDGWTCCHDPRWDYTLNRSLSQQSYTLKLIDFRVGNFKLNAKVDMPISE